MAFIPAVLLAKQESQFFWRRRSFAYAKLHVPYIGTRAAGDIQSIYVEFAAAWAIR